MDNVICAVPYDMSVPTFFFHSIDEYEYKIKYFKDKYNCEEYEYEFIDGDQKFSNLWNAIGSSTPWEVFEVYDDIDNEHDALCIEYLMDNCHMNLEDALNQYENVIVHYGTMKELADQCFPWHGIPEGYHNYIDLDAYSRDLEHDWCEFKKNVFILSI
tara:strand:+ start:150 stop:623 length:474 start_codon:yes stop_codon:yes gene_type:complete